jgi:hypothetical protein
MDSTCTSVCDLPPETLCYIFALSKPYQEGYVIAQVCRHFRKVADADSRIWADINLVCFHRVRELLARTTDIPIRIHVTLGSLSQRIPQIKNKTSNSTRAYLIPRMQPAWAYIMSHAAQRVAEINFEFAPRVVSGLSLKPVTFPQLTWVRVEIEEHTWYGTGFTRSLLAGELPSLRDLYVPRYKISDVELVRIMASSHLNALAIGVPWTDQPLRMAPLPTLVDLHLDMGFWSERPAETILVFPALRKLSACGSYHVVQWLADTLVSPALELVKIEQTQARTVDLKRLLTQVFLLAHRDAGLVFTYTIANTGDWTYAVANHACYVELQTTLGARTSQMEAVFQFKALFDYLRFITDAIVNFGYLCPITHQTVETYQQPWLDAIADAQMSNVEVIRLNQFSAHKLFARWKADARLQSVLERVDVQVVYKL